MRINLLPQEEKKQLARKDTAEVVYLVSQIVSFGIGITALFLVPSFLYLHYGVIIPLERSREAHATSTSVSLETLTREVQSINEKIAVVRTADPADSLAQPSLILKRITDALKTARGAVAGKVTLTAIRLSPEPGDQRAGIQPHYRVDLAGSAENRQILFRFSKELERMEGVMHVDTPISNFVADKNISFNIQLTVQ